MKVTKLLASILVIALISANLISAASAVSMDMLEKKRELSDVNYLAGTLKTDEKNVLLWPVDNGLPGNSTLWRTTLNGNAISDNQNGEPNKDVTNYGMTIENVTEGCNIVAPGDGEVVSLDTIRANNKAEAFLTDIKDFKTEDTVVIKLSNLSKETVELLEYRFQGELLTIHESIVPNNTQNLYILISNIKVSVSAGTTVKRGDVIGSPKSITKDDTHTNGTDTIYVKMFKENGELIEDLDKYISSKYTKTDELAYKEMKDKNEVGDVLNVPLFKIDGDYIVKTDMAGACPVVTDKELLTAGIKKWLKSSPKQITNALKILDDMLKNQEQYKVNLIFVYAVFKLEQAMGTVPRPPSAIPISYNNWGSIKARYGLPNSDLRTWKQFSSTSEMVQYEMYLFAEKGPYFREKKYSVKTIAPTYCNVAWGTKVIKHMQAFYKALEIDAPLNSGDGSSPFLEADISTGNFILKKSGDGFSDVTKVPYNGGYLYYRNYKQFKGTYKNDPYSNGNIHSSGCGPTSIAIILSGYGIEASPRDTARAMGGAHNGGTNGPKLKKCLEKFGLQAKYVAFGHNITQIKQVLTEHLKTGRPISLSVHNNSLNLTHGGHLIAVLAVNSDGTKYLVSNPSGTGAKTGWLDANKLADAATGKYCVLVLTYPKASSEMLDGTGSESDSDSDGSGGSTSSGTIKTDDNAKTVWLTLRHTYGYSAIATAAIMGNIAHEGGFKPNNAENSKVKDDVAYTKKMNSNRSAFVSDKVGYGLCQWTTSGRKGKLWDLAKSKGVGIDDLGMQIELLNNEMQTSYKTKVFNKIKNSTNLYDATVVVLTKFEIPKNQSASVKNKRYKSAQTYYQKGQEWDKEYNK